jgi:putative ABC transport system ATP-binding protein
VRTPDPNPDPDPVLHLRGVTKEHPGTPPVVALRDVTVSVGAGEFVAVTGPSGSGKSTLLAVAGTLERPTSGRVLLAGQAVDARSDGELSAVRSATIGFVFQQFHLLPTESVLHNVADGLLYRGVPAPERLERARATIAAVGLEHRSNHRPGELSGGECQRAAIARALVGEPALLLVEEPTGNLDSATGSGIVSLLAGLQQRGTTVVLVTHNDEVARRAPRCIALRDGCIERDERQ